VKEDKFFELLKDIDDTYILEAHEEDLSSPSASAAKATSASGNKKIKPVTGWSAFPRLVWPIVGGIAALGLVTFGLWKGGVFGTASSGNETKQQIAEHNDKIIDVAGEVWDDWGGVHPYYPYYPTTHDPTAIVDENSTVTLEETTVVTCTIPTIPAFPSDRSVNITGERITDEEAEAFFQENKESFQNMIASCGIPTDDLHFDRKGFHHISYEGIEGESLTIDQTHRDYLIYNRNDLVARITLFRSNEIGESKILYTMNYGGSWFPDFNTFLKAHQGEKLLFFYANSLEIIIAPDGTLMNPPGTSSEILEEYFEGIEKPYSAFFNELASYTP